MQADVMAQMRRRVVISSTIGNALEWFDFTVFGLFAGVIGKLFFPADNPNSSLLLTFATFGIAFAARPLGGLVFGLYADRHGRKKALVVMITLMAFGTGLLGFLPTYGVIGVAAPLLLLLARLIQGFSAGGEFGSASAMLIEFAPPGRRGFYGSFQMVSQSLAFGIGAAMAIGLNLGLSPDAFASWGWRVPFILGILIGPTGWYLRAEVRQISGVPGLSRREGRPRAAEEADHARRVVRQTSARIDRIVLPDRGGHRHQLRQCDIPAGLCGHRIEIAAHQCANGAARALSASSMRRFRSRCSGALSDRIGRRTVIVPALIVYSVLFYLMLQRLAAAPTTTNLWQLQHWRFPRRIGGTDAGLHDRNLPGRRALDRGVADV